MKKSIVVWTAVVRLMVVSLAVLVLFAGPAQALKVTDLDTGGTVSTGTWVIEGDATVGNNAPDDWRVRVATDSWNAGSGDAQVEGWHAAGLELPSNTLGYRVDFTYDLHTWDMYVPYDPSADEGGYYDNFGVNLNGQDFLWDLGLSDPDTSWPGSTWSWGGADDTTLEHTSGQDSIEGDGVYLTVFCSTGLDPDADDEIPSWGSFNDDSAVPEPAGLGLLGVALLMARKRPRT